MARVITHSERDGISVSPMISTRRQADRDGAHAHGNIRPALVLHIQRAAQRNQRIGQGHAGEVGAVGGNPLGAAMRGLAPVARIAQADCEAKMSVQQQLGGHHDGGQHARCTHMARAAEASPMSGLNTVGEPISATLGAPITRRD